MSEKAQFLFTEIVRFSYLETLKETALLTILTPSLPVSVRYN
jgi:hypothetical protein